MNRISRAGLFGLAVLLPTFAISAQGIEPSTAYVRIERAPGGEPQALQTAVVRLVPRSGQGELVVDLVAVIHFGEKAYYQALGRSFEKYDAVLYELVAAQGHAVPPLANRDGANPLRLLQKMCQAMLGLESQLDHISYRRKNFVHADLSPKGMREAMRKRGEDGLTLALGITADLLKQMNLEAQEVAARPKQTEPRAQAFDPLAALMQPGAAVELKRSFAEELVKQSATDGGLGRTLGTILIGDRNQAAMRVFQKQIAAGKKHIAIFYGAAHMPDFERRLTTDFGLKRMNSGWFTAWDLRKTDDSAMEGVLKVLLQELSREFRAATKTRARQTREKTPPKPKKKRRRVVL